MSAYEFLRALHVRDGLLAVLSAALDASSSNPSGIYAVGGYVAAPEAWDAVLAEWVAAVRQWKIPRFHLSELPQLVGHERAKMCEGYFAKIIERSRLHAVGAALFTIDWEQTDWNVDTTPRMGSAYEQSLWFSLKCLAKHCQDNFPGQPIAVLCDVDAPEANIQSIFRQVSAEWPNLNTIAVSDSSQQAALQCADLAAGALRRSWLEIASNPDCDLDWGIMPKGEKISSSVWSLRQGLLLARSIQKHDAAMEAKGSRLKLVIKGENGAALGGTVVRPDSSD